MTCIQRLHTGRNPARRSTALAGRAKAPAESRLAVNAVLRRDQTLEGLRDARDLDPLHSTIAGWKVGYDFNRIPIESPVGHKAQPKPVIHTHVDQHEQSARLAIDWIQPRCASVFRQACACGGTCPKCRGQGRDAPTTEHSEDIGPTADSPIAHNKTTSWGQPLDAATRRFFEAGFGHDFGRVRVHTDTKAAESVKFLNARAYTVGVDVFFGPGQYAPKEDWGRELLAHELVHVVQQGANEAGTQRSVFHDDHGAEREAKQLATLAANGARVSVGGRALMGTVQRAAPSPRPLPPPPPRPSAWRNCENRGYTRRDVVAEAHRQYMADHGLSDTMVKAEPLTDLETIWRTTGTSGHTLSIYMFLFVTNLSDEITVEPKGDAPGSEHETEDLRYECLYEVNCPLTPPMVLQKMYCATTPR